jgi:MinD-like ATPase involved in chromosome partitioning or flagellar assembly
MLVVFGALRSSPGVTTSILAIASCLEGAVVVEADWDGGVLATRLGIAREPGLTSLAAAARTSPDVDLADHGHQIGGGTLVVPGPASADSAIGVWTSVGRRLTEVVVDSSARRLVLVDAGRLSPLSPVRGLVEQADRLVVVARPEVEELHALSTRIGDLRTATRDRISVLLVGDRPYRAADVASQLGVDVVGFLADDRRAAEAISGHGRAVSSRTLRRSALARSARAVAERILEHAGAPAEAEVAPT